MFLQPIHRSITMHTLFPEWILQVIPSLIGFKAFITAFQMIEIPDVHLCGCLIQSIMCSMAIYLETLTFVHRLSIVIRCQPSLASRADEKSSSFFRPHPPHFFGRLRASQFTQAELLSYILPFQRNLQQRVCILVSIPLGI